jgi:phthiodiolone/phenolphthiodiolone dimycocerosates ketoreductase
MSAAEATSTTGERITLGVPGQFTPPVDRVFELAKLAESAGFDAVWWPDHLMATHPQALWTEDVTPLAASQPNPHVHFEPLQLMGAVGAATDRIRVGVSVTDVLRRHPAVLAQSALTAQHLSGGRAVIGLGSGEAMNLEPYGIPFDKPVGRLSEALDVMSLLWESDGPVRYDGRFYQLDDAVLGLRPLDGTPPPIWLASHGPRMLDLLGRKADGWLPLKDSPERYAERLSVIRASAEAVGRDPDAITPSMLGYVVCAPDEATLDRICRHWLVRLVCVLLPAEAYRRFGAEPPFAGASGFHSWVPSRINRAEAERVAEAIPPALVRHSTFHGDAQQIAAQIRAYGDAGLRDLVMWNITGLADPGLTSYSFKVLREVKAILDA